MCLNSSGLNLSFNFLFCENALLVALLYSVHIKGTCQKTAASTFPGLHLKEMPGKNFTFQVYDLQFLLSICYWLGQEHELHFDHNLKPINDHLVEYGKYFKQTWGILIEYNSEKFTKQATKILCFFLQVK